MRDKTEYFTPLPGGWNELTGRPTDSVETADQLRKRRAADAKRKREKKSKQQSQSQTQS